MTLQDIYKNVKKINPLYNGTFSDFVLDFMNCREDFFETNYLCFKYGYTEKIEKQLDFYYRRFYCKN